MTDKNELNLEELKKASGGIMGKELREWLLRNNDTISDRAEKKGLDVFYDGILQNALYDQEEHSVKDFKDMLKEFGLDCDDLM